MRHGASAAEIKKAYKKLAVKWHPDKHTGEASKARATKKFQEIAEAYEALTQPQPQKQRGQRRGW